MTITSLARVQTDRPARYGKQLASHMSRRLNTEWDAEQERGHITFQNEEFTEGLSGTVTLSTEENILLMELTTEPEHVEQIESVIGRHLVGFGSREELVVTWEREGGGGTTYTTENATEKKR